MPKKERGKKEESPKNNKINAYIAGSGIVAEQRITETLEKEVEVEAEDRDEAEQIVSDAWHNSEYILDAEDFKGVTFKAEPPARKRESYER